MIFVTQLLFSSSTFFSVDSRMSHRKGSVFIGPNQFTAFECFSSWLNLALYTVGCWTVTFQKWVSLKHVALWSSVSSQLLLGPLRAQQRGWSQPGWMERSPSVMLCPWGWCAQGRDRAGWFLWGCGWMEWEDHILCCSPRRGTVNLLLNSAALYDWFSFIFKYCLLNLYLGN